MERAYDDAKYGEFSRRPYIDMVIPSLTDPSVAPPGKHILSCFVQYAPYKLAYGTWDEQREAFGNTVIDTISRIRAQLEEHHHRQTVHHAAGHRTPDRPDRRQHFSGRAFARTAFLPAPRRRLGALSHSYPTIYMCGSATHPGGGIMGAPGRWPRSKF